jgi:ADP-ribose pyrophosphatase
MASKSKRKPQVKVISSRVVFRGPVFYVTSDLVIEPGGVKARRDTVRHQGSVVILALDESKRQPRVLLARQFRYPVGDYIWELPAGRIDHGESALAAAKRELMEETGYTARRWKRALFYYSSPGFLDETMAIYLARDLRPGQARPEEDERISTRFFPLADLVLSAAKGTLRDGKTIAGVLWAARAGIGQNPRR